MMKNLFFAVLLVIVSTEERHKIPRRHPWIHSDHLRLGSSPLQRRNFADVPVTAYPLISPFPTRAIFGPPSLFKRYFLITPRISQSSPILTRPLFVPHFFPTSAHRGSLIQPMANSLAVPFSKHTPREILQRKTLFSSPNIIRKTPAKHPIIRIPTVNNRRYSNAYPILPKRKVLRYPLLVAPLGKRIQFHRFSSRSPIASILELPTMVLHLMKRIFRPLVTVPKFRTYYY